MGSVEWDGLCPQWEHWCAASTSEQRVTSLASPSVSVSLLSTDTSLVLASLLGEVEAGLPAGLSPVRALAVVGDVAVEVLVLHQAVPGGQASVVVEESDVRTQAG